MKKLVFGNLFARQSKSVLINSNYFEAHNSFLVLNAAHFKPHFSRRPEVNKLWLPQKRVATTPPTIPYRISSTPAIPTKTGTRPSATSAWTSRTETCVSWGKNIHRPTNNVQLIIIVRCNLTRLAVINIWVFVFARPNNNYS